MTEIKPGTIYNTNYSGKAEVIEDVGIINNIHKVKIRFIETGYEDIWK